jgi:regulator of protease activity HflC (stomatin/prohibitin superfamily)
MLSVIQTWVIASISFLIGFVLGTRYRVKQRVISEYERGLLFKRGSFKGTLNTGIYYQKWNQKIILIDMRQENFLVHQTILTSDNIHIGINITIRTRVLDPYKAFTSSQNYHQDTHDIARSLIKEIGKITTTKTLLKKDEIFERKLKEPLAKQLSDIGIELTNIELIDAQIPHSIQESIADSLEDLVKKKTKTKKVGFQGIK